MNNTRNRWRKILTRAIIVARVFTILDVNALYIDIHYVFIKTTLSVKFVGVLLPAL